MKLLLSTLLAASAAQAQPEYGWDLAHPNVATVAFGVGVKDNETLYIPAMRNLSPPTVYRSDDQSATFQECKLNGFSLMVMGMAIEPGTDNVVFGGMGGNPQYSNNGEVFDPITVSGGRLMFAQSVEYGAGLFGIAGDYTNFPNSSAGFAVSTDHGKSFEAKLIPRDLSVDYTPRYSAIASADTYFVTYAAWPCKAETSLMEGVDLVRGSGGAASVAFRTAAETKAACGDRKAGYVGDVVRTTDGGATWENVFRKDGLYFNGIHCGSATTCMVTAHGEQGLNNGYVYKTSDAGATWEAVIGPENLGFFQVRMLSADEAWVASGRTDSLDNFFTRFWHTLDGGATWTTEDVQGAYASELGFAADGTVGFATAFTPSNQAHLLGFGVSVCPKGDHVACFDGCSRVLAPWSRQQCEANCDAKCEHS